ncbi:MAG: chorismate synthase [Streptococcaceae bacterium]|nr:chorismate synthase [Streptococcaceae bacterium]
MKFLTAGESHGKQLTAILEGIPSNLKIDIEKINRELAKRQEGVGRGARMSIEKDRVEITSGVRFSKTTGAPITLIIQNKDWENWESVLSVTDTGQDKTERALTAARPGHADLVGGIKYGHTDLRNVLERSSARETAIRVAIGAISKQLLSAIGVEFYTSVKRIGGIEGDESAPSVQELIEETKKEGDTLGGVIEAVVTNVPVGLGSFQQWDRKIDGLIAQAMMSINAIKAVEFGDGVQLALKKGSEVMDEIILDDSENLIRRTNHLGGIEGGMTNGMPIIVRVTMKPIPTLMQPLQTVDVLTKQPVLASRERSDVTAVLAASVVVENVLATTLAQVLLETYPSDTMEQLLERVR